MSLEFQGSIKPTLGVEIELQLLSSESLDLTPQGKLILDICKKTNESRIKSEIHQSMVEVDTEISENVKECKIHLQKRMLWLNHIVEEHKLQVSITGTHPFQNWEDRIFSDSKRYQSLHEKFQWLARRMNVYGMHVHIGVSSGDRVLSICRGMIEYLPHLLALTANSPYWHGIDTGMQSCRVNILDAFPYSGIPPYIPNWVEFEHYYNILLKVGAINSFKDLYWYVRPNLLFGTVEVRVCDAMTKLEESMAVVALIQCLVAKINQELDSSSQRKWTREQDWIAPENQWIASRDGLEGMIIVDVLGKRQKISDCILDLIQLLSPIAKALQCLEELHFLKEIIKNGNGAQRQRKVFQKTGSIKEVVAAARREFISSLQEE